MATKAAAGAFRKGSLLEAFLSFEVYKRTQGLTIRALTFLGLMVFVLWGAQLLYARLITAPYGVRVGVPMALVVVSAWVAFRLVNYPPFADFLIDTEWEMRKVTWPTWSQLRRATAVVIAVTLLMAGFLYLVDLVWMGILRLIGVLWVPTPEEAEQAAVQLADWLRYVAQLWLS